MNLLWWRSKSKSYEPKKDPLSIGNVLLKIGYISRDQLNALGDEYTNRADKRLGEFLIEQKTITSEQLEIALLHQRMIRGDRQALRSIMQRTKKRHATISSTIDEIVVAAKQVVIDNGGPDGTST